jgi:hypothetical protein
VVTSDPASVGAARAFAAACVDAAEIPRMIGQADAVADLRLLVSELVTAFVRVESGDLELEFDAELVRFAISGSSPITLDEVTRSLVDGVVTWSVSKPDQPSARWTIEPVGAVVRH